MFENPSILWFLLLLPFVVFLKWIGTKKRKQELAKFISPPMFFKLQKNVSQKKNLIGFLLTLLGVFFVILAWARPQWGMQTETIDPSGHATVLLLDLSKSMNVRDVPPSRMAKAKGMILKLLELRPNDSIALIAFSSQAEILSPLTLDHSAIALFLEEIDPQGFMPKQQSNSFSGTNFKPALEKILEISQGSQLSRANAILFSDGEDLEAQNLSSVHKSLREKNIRVFTIGIGTQKGDLIPTINPNTQQSEFIKDEKGTPVMSRLGAQSLANIAKETGASFYQATPLERELETISLKIESDGVSVSDQSQNLTKHRQEQYQTFLFIGLLCLILAFIFKGAWR